MSADPGQLQIAGRVVLRAVLADQRDGWLRAGGDQGTREGVGQAETVEQPGRVGGGVPGQHLRHLVGQRAAERASRGRWTATADTDSVNSRSTMRADGWASPVVTMPSSSSCVAARTCVRVRARSGTPPPAPQQPPPRTCGRALLQEARTAMTTQRLWNRARRRGQHSSSSVRADCLPLAGSRRASTSWRTSRSVSRRAPRPRLRSPPRTSAQRLAQDRLARPLLQVVERQIQQSLLQRIAFFRAGASAPCCSTLGERGASAPVRRHRGLTPPLARPTGRAGTSSR